MLSFRMRMQMTLSAPAASRIKDLLINYGEPEVFVRLNNLKDFAILLPDLLA